MTQNTGDKLCDENLWLFSRLDDYQRHYSVGFFMDSTGHLKVVNEPAFCFFPTKEVTNLNFILHAPFLLTDSREGIRAGVDHNDKMIQNLAALAADAFEYLRDIGEDSDVRLIDDNIITIIPIDPKKFSDPSNKRKVSFLPFYQAIKEKFGKEALLPTSEGYTSSKDAYWAAVTQLTQLFSNTQLADITENKNAHWVFTTLGREETQKSNRALFSYIDSLIRTSITEEIIINGRFKEYYYTPNGRISLDIIKGITAEFIETQTFEWLHEFYKWLSETKKRKELSAKKPFFLDQDGNAVAAFDEKDQLILFLPVKDVEGYTIVHPKLLENPETKKFLFDIGIKQPSLKDQIYNIILPKYKQGGEINTDSYFMLFFKYYCKCSNDEVDSFIELIRECEFLSYYKNGDSQLYRGSANTMYLPTVEILDYFETKEDVRFIAIDGYRELVGVADEKQLISFLTELGIKKEITILMQEIDYASSEREDLPYHHSTRDRSWEEPLIEGCIEIMHYILENRDVEKSVILWNSLLRIIEKYCNQQRSLEDVLSGTFKYFYYSQQYQKFPSSTATMLREQPWLQDINGKFVIPSELYLDTISEIYDTSSDFADQLMNFLGISNYCSAEDDRNLTDIQRAKIAFADKLREYGIEDETDLVEFQEFRRWKVEKTNEEQRQRLGYGGMNHSKNRILSEDIESLFDDNDDSDVFDGRSFVGFSEKRTSQKATYAVIKDIAQRTLEKPLMTGAAVAEYDEDVDEDEFMPVAVDYSKKIERAKEKSAAEIDQIAHFEELHNKAVQLTQEGKYTVAWFNTLLEIESINSSEANINSKEISISFARVEREPGTERILVLKQPNRYIPQFMENFSDIPLILHIGEQKKTIAIEVASVKSYTLRVKMKNGVDIENIDLSSVSEATIDTKSPAFLLKELKDQFKDLGLAEDFNMKDNLCENIEFVFGPPGTGKTTYLAQNVLIPMMRDNTGCKVLVLTPTNKSADVLVKKIMEISGSDISYTDWLVRFGGTADEEIEQSPVFRDKTFDIRTLAKNVTVSTIARFPYDFFMPDGVRVFLHGINWDYIVIDEASMIPIANIVFPLYKKTPRKFIIAGDPFQIEPIASVDLWKNENIYTMVELKSFVEPETKPYQYKVKLLTTQYRSVPAIGEVFSNFAYGGVLTHYRSVESQRQLNIDDNLGIEALNIIKYPVSKYESIYKAKRLQHSSAYQVYSALFTFEYVCYLSRAISINNPGSLLRIGIIAPYRAQADMIDKLIASEKLPSEVEVQVDTIHGFQGDECDIIFAVFNTPPTISNSKEMFLNKRSIINVSISRARDYLFIVIPDDSTEGISNLRLVKKVESLIKKTGTWNEFLSPDLEKLMFSDSNYLENNAFSTSHQSVNVYGLPEKRYEIRTEDNAVDVQVHREASERIASPTV